MILVGLSQMRRVKVTSLPTKPQTPKKKFKVSETGSPSTTLSPKNKELIKSLHKKIPGLAKNLFKEPEKIECSLFGDIECFEWLGIGGASR